MLYTDSVVEQLHLITVIAVFKLVQQVDVGVGGPIQIRVLLCALRVAAPILI